MDTDRKWIIVRIDGKIASISTDYRELAAISARLSRDRKTVYENITVSAISLEEVWDLKKSATWEDFVLFGTDFQKKVWKGLYDLTREKSPRLICYSDFAETCHSRAAVRAVAHAVGLNPVCILIPCHLIIPKETIDKINEIKKKAESTIFKGDDLCLSSILNDEAIDFGNYALGRQIKRELILKEFA